MAKLNIKVDIFLATLVFSFGSFAFNFNYSNPRDIRNWESFGIVGDAGVKISRTEALRKSLISANVLQLIMPGDNLYIPTNSYEFVWDVWKQSGFQFPLVAIGNHHKGYANEVAYFKMPGEYYAVERKGALFIVLNSDNEKNAAKQIAWADQVLTKSQYPLNFIVFHHPTVTTSKMHEWTEKKEFQKGMRVILKKHTQKITSLIVGHDHSAGMYLLDSTPMVLSGASWESRDVVLPPKDKEIAVSTLWATFKGGFWWSKLDYNALTKEVYVHYNRFDKQQEICTFRVSPKPVAKSRGCQ